MYIHPLLAEAACARELRAIRTSLCGAVGARHGVKASHELVQQPLFCCVKTDAFLSS